jgi:hypothetical protein
MSSIILEIFTTNNIGAQEYAKRFFAILDKYNILPDKIGLFEPLKTDYRLDKAIEMWILKEGDQPEFRGGGLIGKKKEPNIRFDVDWSIGARATINHITIWFTRKSFKFLRNEIENLFKDSIFALDAFYGYVADFYHFVSQHVTGTLETRMNGIFWCNYFGEIYVDFFGKEKILTAPWYKTELLAERKILAYLTPEPDIKEYLKQVEGSDVLVDRIKEHLGEDSFGDVKAWKAADKTKDDTQYKNVPRPDFSEIRKPLSSFNL